MRKFFILISAFIISFTLCAQNKTVSKAKLDIFYFHSTNRCATCISIETNTKKVLEKYFKKEVDAGTIKMHVMDCEDAKHKKLVEKYGAYGSTLVLQCNTGSQVKDDVTNFAFSYSKNNSEKFISGLKEKIEKLLK